MMSYTLNGQPVSIPDEPVERAGTLYVPLAQVMENLGGRVRWNSETKMAAAQIGPWTAAFRLNAETADVNGMTIRFIAPPSMIKGQLYVPALFFQDAYGYIVHSHGKEVNISV